MLPTPGAGAVIVGTPIIGRKHATSYGSRVNDGPGEHILVVDDKTLLRQSGFAGNAKTEAGEASAMSTYRMYFKFSGTIYGREDFKADDDIAAIRIARVLYNTCSDLCDSFELWQGARHIRARQPPHQNACLADLIDAHQRVTLATEERISQSRWRIANSQRLIAAVDGKMTTAKYKGCAS
jgi:hypothetical protein